MANFLLQATCLWMLLCLPGLILVSYHILLGKSSYVNSFEEDKGYENIDNRTEIACYEKKDDYYAAVEKSRFWIEGT